MTDLTLSHLTDTFSAESIQQTGVLKVGTVYEVRDWEATEALHLARALPRRRAWRLTKEGVDLGPLCVPLYPWSQLRADRRLAPRAPVQIPVHPADESTKGPKGSLAMSRVLVIDDEPVVGLILRMAFEAKGHEILVAEGGRSGIDTARAEHPDAVVLDLMMPAVNGYDVLEALRDDLGIEEVPILVLTAVTLSRERERCLSEGADVVMTKPFDPRDVADAVDDLLSPRTSAAAAGS